LHSRRRFLSLVVLFAVTLVFAAFGGLPRAYADTFGITSTSGMATYTQQPYQTSLIWLSRFVASTGGQLSSISFFALNPSGNGNVGIYADGTGSTSPGSLLAQGTPQPLVNGLNTFSSLSTTVAITTSTGYWLAFVMSAGSVYYGATGLRGWAGPVACCSMPSTVTLAGSAQSANAIYATYSTGPLPNDFTITATTTSQSVGAGATADYSLSIQYGSSLSATVDLGVTSGCPTGVTCTFSPPSVTGSSTVTLSVPTLPTTPEGTTTITVTAASTSPALSHTVQVQLTVNPPGSYPVYVYAGASKVTVTVTWSGSGTAAIYLAGPGGSPTLSESGAVIYDRVVYVSGSSTPTYIHRVTFTLSSPPTSTQTWNALVALTGSYTVTIEVNSPSPPT